MHLRELFITAKPTKNSVVSPDIFYRYMTNGQHKEPYGYCDLEQGGFLTGREVWLVIKDAPRYSVSSHGRVRNDETGKLLKPGLGKRGYFTVSLHRDGMRPISKTIHRLVAIAFYDIADLSLDVNHYDGSKTNNFVGNLEWATRSENVRHAFRIGLCTPHGTGHTKVRVLETGVVYESQAACAYDLNLNAAHITNCLRGRRSSHGGYPFEYA